MERYVKTESRDRPQPEKTDVPGLSVRWKFAGHMNGQWLWEREYDAEVIDRGDCSELPLPDGRRGTVPTQARRPLREGDPPTVLRSIRYRICESATPGQIRIQVLGYKLADDSPPEFSGCPVLEVTLLA